MDFFSSFNGAVDGIRDWLKKMDLSLKSENVPGVESQRGASDAAEELERIDRFYRNLRAKRFACLSKALIIAKINKHIFIMMILSLHLKGLH